MARSVIYALGVTTAPSPSKDARPYHHGDLPRALLDAAIQAILEVGPAAVSLRDLARRAGVSHAAPAHHFGDKAGLLTAVATDGFRRLAATLRETYQATGSFLEVGVAYVRFAVTHRAHFEVMFRPELYAPTTPSWSRPATQPGRCSTRQPPKPPPAPAATTTSGPESPPGPWSMGWPRSGSTTTCRPSWATTPSGSPAKSPTTSSDRASVNWVSG
jgi:tetracycline repressor-like protein